MFERVTTRTADIDAAVDILVKLQACIYHARRRVLHFLSSQFLKRFSQETASCTLEILSRSEKSWENNFLSCECKLHPLVYNYIFNGRGIIVWLIFILKNKFKI